MESLTLFLLASLALIATPGPDFVYVLTRGISDGKWAGVISATGVTCGILVHTIATSLGLAALLKTSIYLFWTLKIAGGVYLIYIGYQMERNKKAFEVVEVKRHLDLKKCFLQGLLSNVLNPKVALFFIAFLPQFVSLERPNHTLHMMFLGFIYAVMTIVVLAIVGSSAGLIGAWLRERTHLAIKSQNWNRFRPDAPGLAFAATAGRLSAVKRDR